MKKFVTLKRVSTREQGNSGLGLEAQERDIQLFLENYAESPYEVVKEFVEIQSGKDTDRQVLKDAISFAKKHKCCLLVAKLDRLSRKLIHTPTSKLKEYAGEAEILNKAIEILGIDVDSQ